jgi:hypothetical protein
VWLTFQLFVCLFGPLVCLIFLLVLTMMLETNKLLHNWCLNLNNLRWLILKLLFVLSSCFCYCFCCLYACWLCSWPLAFKPSTHISIELNWVTIIKSWSVWCVEQIPPSRLPHGRWRNKLPCKSARIRLPYCLVMSRGILLLQSGQCCIVRDFLTDLCLNWYSG